MIPAARKVTGNVLPHSIESERSVLGGVLLAPKAFAQVGDIVVPEDFYDPKHEAIFRAMTDLVGKGSPVDEITVAEEMRRSESWAKLRAVGSEMYFAELTAQVVTVENIGFHARMVRGKAVVRRLIETANEIAARGYGEYGDVNDYLEGSARSVLDVVARGTWVSPVVAAPDAVQGAVRVLEQRYEARGQGAVVGMPSGYPDLDAMTTGWRAGELVIVAGRPSMGKTSFVVNAVENAGAERGVPALVFSREMPTDDLVLRMLSGEAKITSSSLRTLNLNGRDWVAITHAARKIAALPVWFDDATATVSGIEAEARRWVALPAVRAARKKADAGVVVIDYLQLLSNPIKGANREREIADASRRLKLLAKELGVTVIALSQLNRGPEREKDKRPRMADLRESGAIEQDADSILFVYRDEVYNKQSPDKGVAEIIIAKQRNGPIGTVRLAFLGAYTRFEALAGGGDTAHWHDDD